MSEMNKQLVALAPGIFTAGGDPVVGLVMDDEKGIQPVVAHQSGFGQTRVSSEGGLEFTGPWLSPRARSRNADDSGAAAF